MAEAGAAAEKLGALFYGRPGVYPAGREIEQTAARYDGSDPIRFPIARVSGCGLDFSFSGLKTAVKYYLADKSPELAKVRLNWSSTKTPELVLADLIRAAEAGLVRPDEFRKNAVKFGLELWEEKTAA